MRNGTRGSEPSYGRSDDPMQAAMWSFGQAGKAFDPCMKAAARSQAEMTSLMSQRAQAYLGIPGRLSGCRTPHDLVTEQLRFWQSAAEQYAAASRNIMSAWASTMPTAGMINAPSRADAPVAASAAQQTNSWMMMPFWMMGATPSPTRAPADRDYITFPELQPQQPDHGTRRAA